MVRGWRKIDLSLAVVTGRLGLFDPGLVGLGHSVHDTSDTTDSDGGDVAKVGWVTEEQDARGSDGEPAVHQRMFGKVGWTDSLVESSDHRVCGRTACSDTPCRGVGDEDGDSTREDDSRDQVASTDLGANKTSAEVSTSRIRVYSQVSGKACPGPVLNQD